MANTFSAIPQEKRERIINAALEAFAANGYRKTSAADIASSAGISKAMVFSYFGSKQGMYEYLCDYAFKAAWEEFRNNAHKLLIDDFFDRIRLSVDIKLALMKRHKALLMFLTSMYYERDEAVRAKIDAVLAESSGLSEGHMLKGIDKSRFKEGVDAAQAAKILTWMSEGLANEWRGKPAELLDELANEFYAALETLKNSLYREEIL